MRELKRISAPAGASSLRADLLCEPLASCLTGDAERDPDLAPGPTVGACKRHEFADASLTSAHTVNRFSDGAQVGRVVHRDAAWVGRLGELRGSLNLLFGMHCPFSSHRCGRYCGRAGIAWTITGSSVSMPSTPTSSSSPSRAGPTRIVRSSSSCHCAMALRTAWRMSSSAIPCFRAGSAILTVTRYLVSKTCQGTLSL